MDGLIEPGEKRDGNLQAKLFIYYYYGSNEREMRSEICKKIDYYSKFIAI